MLFSPTNTVFKLHQTEIYIIYKQTFFCGFSFMYFLYFSSATSAHKIKGKLKPLQSMTTSALLQPQQQMHNKATRTNSCQKPTWRQKISKSKWTLQLHVAAAASCCLVLLISTTIIINLTCQIHHVSTRSRYQWMSRRQYRKAQEHENTNQRS